MPCLWPLCPPCIIFPDHQIGGYQFLSLLGDVITALGEREVTTAGDLVAALDNYNVGNDVALQIRRDASGSSQGKNLSLALTLQEEVS